MTKIIQGAGRWEVIGDVLMDNANTLLIASRQLTLEKKTTIDFKSVGELDTVVVSLMLEWLRRAKAEGQTLIFVNMPSSLKSLLSLYGLSEMFS